MPVFARLFHLIQRHELAYIRVGPVRKRKQPDGHKKQTRVDYIRIDEQILRQKQLDQIVARDRLANKPNQNRRRHKISHQTSDIPSRSFTIELVQTRRSRVLS